MSTGFCSFHILVFECVTYQNWTSTSEIADLKLKIILWCCDSLLIYYQGLVQQASVVLQYQGTQYYPNLTTKWKTMII